MKKNKLRGSFPSGSLLPLLIMAVANFLSFYGTRLVNADKPHLEMILPLDRQIEVQPAWVLVYVGCFAFWVVNFLLIAADTSPEDRSRFFAGELMAKVLSTLCFLLIPTVMLRPELPDDGVCSWLLGLIYRLDAPDNLFPSIHCLDSIFAWYGLRFCRRVPRWYRVFSAGFALAVFAAVLFTKQHVVLDVPGAVVIAVAGILLARLVRLERLYPWLERRVKVRKKTGQAGK